MKQMQGLFTDTAESSVERLIVDHKRLADVLHDVVKEMERAALKGLLTGKGGLAGLFGGGEGGLFGMLSGKGGEGGGGLAALFKGFAGLFADGGAIPAGQFGLVGERGPELISGPATITPIKIGAGTIPSAASPARAGDYKPTIYATFHMGGVTSRDEVQGWVQTGMAQAHAAALRDMPGALAEKQNRSW